MKKFQMMQLFAAVQMSGFIAVTGVAAEDAKPAQTPADTPKVSAEESLKQANEKAKQISQVLRDAVNKKDFEGALTQWNIISGLSCATAEKYNAFKIYAGFLKRERKFDDFCGAWEKFCLQFPGLPEIRGEFLWEMGDIAWSRRKPKDAEKYFRMLADGDAVSCYSWNERGFSDLMKKVLIPQNRSADMLEAIASFRRKYPTNIKFQQEKMLAEFTASAYMLNGDLDKGVAVHDELLQKWGNKSEITAQILLQKGHYYSKISRMSDAADAFAKSAAVEPNRARKINAVLKMTDAMLADNLRKDAVNRAKEILFDGNDGNKSVKIDNDLILTDICTKAKQWEIAYQLLDDAEKTEGITNDQIQKVDTARFNTAFVSCDMDKSEQYIEVLIRKNNRFRNDKIQLLAERFFERGMLKDAVKYYRMLPLDIRADVVKVNTRLRAYALAGYWQEALEIASQLAANTGFSKENRAYFQILTALSNVTDPAEVKVKTAEIQNHWELSGMQYANILGDAGKFYISIGKHTTAKMLNQVRSELFKPEKNNELVVSFVEKSPSDVTEWVEYLSQSGSFSPRQSAKVEFGAKEAANLVTDVMALGRKVGDSAIQADKETYFDVSCDAQGIHLFFIGIDSRTDDIVNDRISDGGYEMYMALGENQPSYQWLFCPFKKDLNIPPWNSPHEYFRLLDDYMTFQSKAVTVTIDDKEYKGIANVMNFSWDLAYDRLPSDGDTWPFEIIRWTRGGGVTWGGKSVWQIGRWGRWKFAGLNAKAVKAIRTNVIYHALARYNAQKEPRTGGLVALWQDAELGDKTFYEKCIAGKVQELDELAQLVTDNMSDETVEKLWLEAVPYWFDFQYFVSKERTKYLTNNLTD